MASFSIRPRCPPRDGPPDHGLVRPRGPRCWVTPSLAPQVQRLPERGTNLRRQQPVDRSTLSSRDDPRLRKRCRRDDGMMTSLEIPALAGPVIVVAFGLLYACWLTRDTRRSSRRRWQSFGTARTGPSRPPTVADEAGPPAGNPMLLKVLAELREDQRRSERLTGEIIATLSRIEANLAPARARTPPVGSARERSATFDTLDRTDPSGEPPRP